MKKIRLKKSVLYGIYGILVCAFFGTVLLIESANNKKDMSKQEEEYVTKSILDDTVSVVAEEDKMIKPYTDPDVKIVQNYYNYKDEEKKQQESIIYYQNTYMPSSGVSYGGKEDFDVVAIFDGTVTKVTNDDTLGTIIEIKHSDNVTSVYQSLGDTTVKENETVTQGQIIGKSGVSNLQKDLQDHLYFELLINGNTVNPEEYFGKTLSEL